MDKNINNKDNSLSDFKKRILNNIDSVDISFEVGYCYKNAITDCFEKDSYWVQCYYFLKGLAHYKGVDCWC